MGMSLGSSDFIRVLKHPKIISLGVILQFSVMPLAALIIAKLWHLSDALTVGMVLVGSVSGGTASNLITYLAKGDVALSITMTTVSTLLSVLITPFLTYLYLDQRLDIPTLEMFLTILKIVILPVFAGVMLHRWYGKFIRKNESILTTLSMLFILIIIAIVVALNRDNLHETGFLIMSAVIVHNTIGLASGYAATAFLGYDEKTRRTVGIEVGMQNSGLAVALALQHFSSLSALPGALFSIWHNISGALISSYWHRRPTQDTSTES